MDSRTIKRRVKKIMLDQLGEPANEKVCNKVRAQIAHLMEDANYLAVWIGYECSLTVQYQLTPRSAWNTLELISGSVKEY